MTNVYLVTGTDKETGKRVILGHPYYNKNEADDFMNNITFNQYRDLPRGVKKQDAQDMMRCSNIRIKKVVI